MIQRFVFTTLVCLMLVAPVRGDELHPQYLRQAEQAIDDAIEAGDIPGAVLLLGDSSGVTYRKAFGHRRLRPTRQAMTVDTIFDVASLTKALATGPAIVKLIEQGKLALEDPVSKHLPSFGAAGKKSVTVAQLLLHTSGLQPVNDADDYADGRDAAFAKIDNLQLEHEPGRRFDYSDLGYITLGRLVEKVSGLPLDAFVHEQIYKPLGMNHTRFNPPAEWRDRIAPTTVTGRVHDPRAAALGGIAGHAGVFTTADDIARFCRMLLHEGELDGTRIFSELTVDWMTESRPLEDGDVSRALGFDVDSPYSSARGRRFSPGTTFGHTGFTGVMFWVDPQRDAFVVLLTNRLHTGRESTVDLYREVSTFAAKAMLGPLRVWTGIDVLASDNFKLLDGLRVGLITNHTGIDRRRYRTVDLMHEADNFELAAVFSPEHGLYGKLDEKVGHAVDPKTQLKVFSLYGDTRKPTPDMLQGLDAIVFDIQDIGTRFYTYIATMANAMEAAGENDVRFIVLDRPNPIMPLGVRGPIADEDLLSFVAAQPIPVTHGMTVGELARLFKHEFDIDCELTVVPMIEYRRDLWFDETALPWVDPSPNMRSVTAASLYPGIGLLEFSNLSVGRGTDEPFERLGAPWIDGRMLTIALNEADLPGLRFVPIRFVPESSKFKGETCEGVHLIVTDRNALQPIRTGLTIGWYLRGLFGDRFERDPVLKLLADQDTHETWQTIADPAKLPRTWADHVEAFKSLRRPYLIYR